VTDKELAPFGTRGLAVIVISAFIPSFPVLLKESICPLSVVKPHALRRAQVPPASCILMNPGQQPSA
jgi:hypothetical protein